MSDIITGLRKHLMAATTVADLVGGRIYPGYLPQRPGVFPAVVLSEISRESEQHLTGGAGLAHTRVQVDCYGETHLAAYAAREAIRRKVVPSTGGTWDTVVVADVGHENFRTDIDSPQDGSENWRFVAGFDLLISHEEAEPA